MSRCLHGERRPLQGVPTWVTWGVIAAVPVGSAEIEVPPGLWAHDEKGFLP